MSFQSSAQEILYVIDPTSPASRLPANDHNDHQMSEPLSFDGPISLEVIEPGEIELVVEELPGAPEGTKDPEPMIEVSDGNLHVEEKEDENDAKKGKNEKWDWQKHGPTGFVAWIKSRLEDIPEHSGYDTAGLERARAYMDRLDNEISRAMRMDLDGELDADKIEKVRSQIDDGISRLQSRLDKVKDTKKSNRKRKKSAEYEIDEDGFIKEAQKIAGVRGVYVMAPLFISSLARICMNGMVSAGHDIEDMYRKLCTRYKLTDREKLELRQLMFDMGLPMRVDLGVDPNEDLDITSSDNYGWAANFPG